MEENDKLPVHLDGGEEMVAINCGKCGQNANLEFRSTGKFMADLELRGVITCKGRDAHHWPITIRTDNIIRSTDQWMPVSESANLTKEVPEALIQDVKAAESTYFAEVFRASTVMCRRAIQLGFQEPPYNIPDGPYGTMLNALMALPNPPLSTGTHGLASSIGDYGGIGAHNPKPVSPEEARSTIFTSVRVLNELFPQKQ